MRVYSPSQTKEWLTCPVKRRLRYVEGVRARRYGKRELAAILGTGFSAGVASYHRMRIGDPTRPVERALDAARHELDLLDNGGYSIWEGDISQRTSLLPRLQKAVERYVARAPIPPSWDILAVEHVLEDGGNGRLDLAARTPLGGIVADIKCKLTLDARYLQKEKNRYRNDWQLLHYCYFYSQEIGAPISHYYIIFVILEPTFQVILEPYVVTPETMQIWHQSAERVWVQMEREDIGEKQPWIAGIHSDQYGDCEYYNLCFEYHWDMRLAGQEYTKGE